MRTARGGAAALAAALCLGISAAPSILSAGPARAQGSGLEDLTRGSATGERAYVVTYRAGAAPPGAVSEARPILDGTGVEAAVVSLAPGEPQDLRTREGVLAVEPDSIVAPAGTGRSPKSDPPPWGLDRIDQTELPLDGAYAPPSRGAGVDVYVVDSGIDYTNPDFAGRIGSGAGIGGDAQDCDGHGTHVAGTIAAQRFGTAPEATIHPVRIMDCTGMGRISSAVAGLDWIADNAAKASVVNLSFAGRPSTALDSAVKRLIRAGHVVVAAAGNESRDACASSPARVRGVITVAAADREDRQAAFSNHGRCVDLFAPGVRITSTWPGGGTRTESGTSMAAPHAAGAAAVYWGYRPGASGGQVVAALRSRATRGVVSLRSGGSPDRYLNVGWGPRRTEAAADPAGRRGAPAKPVVRVRAGGRAAVRWAYPAGEQRGFEVQAAPKATHGWQTAGRTKRSRWTGRVESARPWAALCFRVRARLIDGPGPFSRPACARPRR